MMTFALVKPVDPNDPAIADVISEWADTPDAVGIRIPFRMTWQKILIPQESTRLLREASRQDTPINSCAGTTSTRQEG